MLSPDFEGVVANGVESFCAEYLTVVVSPPKYLKGFQGSIEQRKSAMCIIVQIIKEIVEGAMYGLRFLCVYIKS
jgi:hypothetical protein